MPHKKKAITIVALAAVVLLGTAATITPAKMHRNLKVLPQDISDRQLDSIMDNYCRALKVNCDFCHVKPKDITGLAPVTGDLDFALDNEMKENARRMMRMTIDINKNHFNFDSTKRPDYLLNVVTCNTCHRGNPFPAHE
ncbi:MAG: c-type cytochrome [Chitinophagaceae bacterium]|nr:c-type cytochrome [Chitinophagaceae bacterium]